MDAQAALAAIAAIQEQLDDLKAYVLSQQAVKGTAVATLGSMTAVATGTVRTSKPARSSASGRVTTAGTIWNEPMPWEAGFMQKGMR